MTTNLTKKPQQMKKEFIDLLNVHGVSGEEKPVRRFIQKRLVHLVDKMFVDHYGNLLAEKTCGDGRGATILLSAHMDTVRGVLKDRNLIIEGDIITSDVGALGADDRAGIAIIMEVLRNVDKLSFNGTIKVAFTRQEEVGCIGSSKMNPKWYQDADLAIVVDRRGTRDIVTGCYNAFCCNEVGDFLEQASQLVGMDYKCVEGGISDAMTFSDNGVNSVNLSAGYMHEHTAKEYVSLSAMTETAIFIIQAIAVINDFCHTFTEVPYYNDWVKQASSKYYTKTAYSKGFTGSYDKYGSYSNNLPSDFYDGLSQEDYELMKAYGSTEYFEDEMIFNEDRAVFEEEEKESVDFWYEDDSTYAYQIHDKFIISQGADEIALTAQQLKSIFSAAKKYF